MASKISYQSCYLLKRADGNDAHPEVKNKKQLIERMAETIAKLKSRDWGKASPSVLDEVMKQAKKFRNPAQASASSIQEEQKNKKGKKKSIGAWFKFQQQLKQVGNLTQFNVWFS